MGSCEGIELPQLQHVTPYNMVTKARAAFVISLISISVKDISFGEVAAPVSIDRTSTPIHTRSDRTTVASGGVCMADDYGP